jgi:hypothetical protein
MQTTEGISDFAYRKGGTAASTAVGAVGYGASAALAVAPLFATPAAPIAAAAVVVASIIGGIKGFLKDNEYKNKAKNAAGDFVKSYSNFVESAFASNDFRNVSKAMNSFTINMDKMADAQLKEGTARSEANKLWEEESKKYQIGLSYMTAKTGDLKKITGLTTEGVINLANSMDVDLSNSMMTLQETLAATGIATLRFGQEFNNALIDSYANAVSAIRGQVDILNAPVVINEAAQSLREQAISGTLSPEVIGAGLETIMQQQLLLSGGDPLEAYKQLISDLGAPGTRGGGQFNIPGNVFYGLREAFGEAGFDPIRNAAFGAVRKDIATLTAENLISGAAGVGMNLGVSKDSLVSLLSGMNDSELTALAERARAGTVFTSPGGVNALGTQGGGIPFDQQLRNVFTDPKVLEALKPDQTEIAKMQENTKIFQTSVGGFRTSTDQIFAEAVRKFDLAVDRLPGGDTASPRRNIVSTLGAHSKFDAMIAGNRSITSGYRTWGLGSTSSDHAAGRAYDLVGQNLGLYQMAVKANGGYAEFHGGSSGRHLHVVPNVDSPIGDTAMPYMGGPVVSSGGVNATTVNMTINASPGMDVNALASEVMSRLERETRSRQERY